MPAKAKRYSKVWIGIAAGITSLLLVLCGVLIGTLVRPQLFWREYISQTLGKIRLHADSVVVATGYKTISTVAPSGSDFGCGNSHDYKLLLYSNNTLESIKKYYDNEFIGAGWDIVPTDGLTTAMIDSNTAVFIYGSPETKVIFDAPGFKSLAKDLVSEDKLDELGSQHENTYLIVLAYWPKCWLAAYLPHRVPGFHSE